MIRLKDLPAQEKAMDEIVKKLTLAGYDGEEAQRLTDEASAIAIHFFKTLDDKIDAISTDEEDRAVVQALVLTIVTSTSGQIIDLINAHSVMQLFRRMFR